MSVVVALQPRRFGKTLAAQVAQRGYAPAFRQDQVNHCPGCGRSHWYVGRFSAECAFCGTALPFAGSADPITIGKDV